MAKETKVTESKSISHYFSVLLYECMLESENEIILSTIHKYRNIAEQLIILLKMWGWRMDDNIEKNPYEVIEKGKYRPLTLIKFKLKLDPVIEAMQEEIIKDKKSRDVLLYLLNNLHSERKKYSDFQDTIKNMDLFKDNEILKSFSTIINVIKGKYE